MSCSVN